MKIGTLLHIILLLCLCNFGESFGSSISPELEKKLKSEGKWEQFIETLQININRGINLPNKNPVNFNDINLFEKNTIYLNGLVILVDFDDQPADTLNHNPAAFEHLLFSEGTHATGSMNDFYLENSYNNIGVNGVVTVWLRMPQNYTYYVDGQKGFGNYPNNAQKLAEDAVAAADPMVDFSQYDNDNDGYVDALFVVHSGAGYESSGNVNDIHSHAWSISSPQTRDGVIISSYSMEPELHNTSGEMVRMGVFGHEFGHVLGLPDLYDTDYSSRGLGSWSMMSGGSWNGGGNSPSHFDAWSKYQLGWINPMMVTKDTSGVVIPAIEDTAVSYILWTEGQVSSEYFIVENRQKLGFDSYLPSSGLLIYHVDESMSGNTDDWHPLVMLEQADGLFNLQNNGNSGDAGDPFPGQTTNIAFNDNTIPGSVDYNNDSTFVSVLIESYSNGLITAELGVEVPFPILSFTNTGIIDSTGDNEGDADPGENVYLSLVLENIGAATDSALIELTSNDSQVVWLDSTEFVHSINRDDLIILENAFQVSFSSNMSDPTYVVIDIMVTYPNGFYNEYFSILVGDNPGFSSNMEGDPRIWDHYSVTQGYNDEWHVESYRNHTSNGQFSFKMGGSGSDDYGDLNDSALESPEIEIGSSNDAVLTFSQIMFAEDENSTNTAWDGGLVELSDDDGLTWQIIYPDGGYPYTIINNPASPFTAGTSVFSGQIPNWQEESFDLSAYSGVIKIRFRFGSDGYVTEEGWYIDDVKITTGMTGTESAQPDLNLPHKFALSQNYPNPFNPRTTITFSIPKDEHVSLKVFDVLGKEVATLISNDLKAGEYRINWQANSFSNGVYFYTLKAGEFHQTRKLILIE